MVVALVVGVLWLRRRSEPTMTVYEVEVPDYRAPSIDRPHRELPFAAKYEAELRARDALRAHVHEEQLDDLNDDE